MCAILLLSSCSTVTPDVIKDNQSSYDSSTPKQYDSKNSGIIGFVTGDKEETTGAIVTSGFRNKYNNLIGAYSWQLYDSEKIKVKPDEGIEYYKDIYGNDLFIIQSQYLAYFLKMNRWKKEMRDDDSIWMKIKHINQ